MPISGTLQLSIRTLIIFDRISPPLTVLCFRPIESGSEQQWREEDVARQKLSQKTLMGFLTEVNDFMLPNTPREALSSRGAAMPGLSRTTFPEDKPQTKSVGPTETTRVTCGRQITAPKAWQITAPKAWNASLAAEGDFGQPQRAHTWLP